jgi:hypothetical protein
MSEQDNVVFGPFSATESIPPEERAARRLTAAAADLASPARAPGEWKLLFKGRAAELGVPPETLEDLIVAQIEGRKEKAAERRLQVSERRLEVQSAEIERKRAREQQRIEEAGARNAAPTTSEWDEIEPWAEPVATAALLQELVDKIGSHVAAQPHEILVIALWVMMSWVHEVAATHSAYLVVTSAEPDSGKTTTLGCVRFLALKPYVVIEATGSTLFRYIDQHKPTTVIMDEADDLFERKADVRHVFNAGWTRGTKIPRQEKKGNDWVTVQFDPFTPKAVGLLGLNMPRTLVGRSIVITLRPKTAAQTVEDFGHIDDAVFEQLRRKLARWSADNAVALKGAKPLLPAGFANRTAANWRLLLAIAELADRGENARKAAEELSKVIRKPSLGMQLLTAIRAIFDDRKVEVISSKALVAALIADHNGPWCEYRGKKPITQRQVAVLLDPYEIHPGVVHPTKSKTSSPSGYKIEQFEEAFARLPPVPHILTPQPPSDTDGAK